MLPIGIALARQWSAGIELRMFLYFLLAGFITDMTMWLMVELNHLSHLFTVFIVYSLIESLFFFWFLSRHLSGRLRRFSSIMCILAFPFWLLVVFIPATFYGDYSGSQFYDPGYEVTAAFLSGFALLKMAEQGELFLRTPNFWLLMGIFFYCFCTFFVMVFVDTFLSQKLWFVNNIINIITYAFYSFGLFQPHASTLSYPANMRRSE